MPIFLGVDPSLVSTGLVVLKSGEVVHQSTIKTEPTKTAQEELARLNRIIDGVFEVVEKWHGKDMVAVMETPTIHVMGSSTAIAQLCGLSYLLRDRFQSWAIPLLLVNPSTLKKFVSGKGNSQKEDMKLAVFKRWGFEAKSNDIVDSFGLCKLAECKLDGFGTKADLEAIKKVEVIYPQVANK